MLSTNPCVSLVPQNPNSQRSVAPGLQRVISSMVNESLILRKRQLRAASGSHCCPKTSELFLKQDKVKEIMFDLLWHSYNYLDPGEEPFLWLGCCHLIFHLKDVKSHISASGASTLQKNPRFPVKVILQLPLHFCCFYQ